MADPRAAAPLAEPSRGRRFAVLLAVSAAMFANYYVFDALYPVAPLLQARLGFTDAQIGLLDTAYNVAALLTLVGGGLLIDRLGTAPATLLFSVVGAAGAALVALLPMAFPGHAALAMAAGRFVLGIGSELFIVSATTVVSRWFRGKEISFALAVQLLVARLGSWLADRSPDLARGLFGDWRPPLLVAAGFGGLWLALAAVYAALERASAGRFAVAGAAAPDRLAPRDLFRYGRSYWWVVGICVAFYSTIFPFRTFANLYLIEAHGVAPDEAGSLKSILPLVSMFGMPLFGLVADRFGRRALLLVVGSALLVPPFLLMAHTRAPLTLSMVLLGLAFALVPAVLWPVVTWLVPDARLGSAYALMTFCQQVGWAGMSWALGAANDAAGAGAANPAGWLPATWMLAGLAAVGLLFALLLWRDERGPAGHGLEAAAPSRHAA
jgi:MFS family permease